MGKKQTSRWFNKEKCLKLQERFGEYETYEETGGGRGENKKTIIRVLKNLAKTFPDKPSILEVGSGPGHFIWVMKDVASMIVGVDNSPHMLEISKDVFKTQKNVKFIESSCWDIKLENDSYDLVFQVDVCMHIGGTIDSLREMIRVAKKYIVFTGPSFEVYDHGKSDIQIGKISWSVNIPVLEEYLNKLINEGKINKFWYEERPSTKVYKHRILVIQK